MNSALKLALKTVAVATLVKVTFDLLDKAVKEDYLGKAQKKVQEVKTQAEGWVEARRSGSLQDPS